MTAVNVIPKLYHKNSIRGESDSDQHLLVWSEIVAEGKDWHVKRNCASRRNGTYYWNCWKLGKIKADRDGRAVWGWGVGVRQLVCWDCGFEYCLGLHECLCLVSVACPQVEVSTSGRSIIKRSPAYWVRVVKWHVQQACADTVGRGRKFKKEEREWIRKKKENEWERRKRLN